MADSIEMSEFERPKLPQTLNILTILSIIGCILQFGGAIMAYVTAKTNFDNRHKTLEELNKEGVPDFAKNMIGDPDQYLKMMEASYNNRLPIFILAVVAVALCFYGVLQMRKLKKQGFMFYVIGQILPFISMAALLGFAAMSGIAFMVGTAIVVLFIILYATQRKHLVY